MKNFIIDPAKVKEKDREFLMNRALNIAFANSSNKLSNTAIVIAIFSVLLSSFSILYGVVGTFSAMVIVIGVVELIIFIFFYLDYRKKQKNVSKQLNVAVNDHNLFFRKKFDYCQKSDFFKKNDK